METTLDIAGTVARPRFTREPMERPMDRAFDREYVARMRAERVASDLARMVAHESRRAEDERKRRVEAEAVASNMAALIAHENARAELAERRLHELLQAD
jgi:hypothetical protein